MNWLVGQTRQLGERLTQTEQQAMQMQEALQKKCRDCQYIYEEQELVHDWQAYIEKLQKESEDALQESRNRELGCTRTSRRWRRSGRRKRLKGAKLPTKVKSKGKRKATKRKK